MAQTALRRMVADSRGTSAVELALVLPLFMLLLYGIMGYGQYFLLAHSIQQLANDAARSTMAGMSPAERRTLAERSVRRGVTGLPELAASRVTTTMREAPGLVAVTVSYDASNLALIRNAIIPMPSAVIARGAVIEPGELP